MEEMGSNSSKMASSDSNEEDCCSPTDVEFSDDMADNVAKKINVIARHLEDLQMEASSITLHVVELESAYTPVELAKTEAELRLREFQLLPKWQELRNIESQLRTKNKTLRETHRDVRKLNSEMISHERQQSAEKQKFRKEIENKKKRMEVKSEDKTTWEHRFSQVFDRYVILGMEQLLLLSQSNLIKIHEIMSKIKKLKRRTDTLKRTLEAHAKKADTLKCSVEQERREVGQELRKLRGHLTSKGVPYQEQVVADAVMLAAAAAHVRKYKKEEATGSAGEKPKKEPEKKDNKIKTEIPKKK